MSAYAGFTEVISDRELKKLFPNEYKKFNATLKRKKETLDSFASEFDAQPETIDSLGYYDTILNAYNELVKAFEAKFKGMSITLKYMDCDAECHDLQTNYYWSVDGMYTISKAGKELQKVTKNKVTTITFVLFD